MRCPAPFRRAACALLFLLACTVPAVAKNKEYGPPPPGMAQLWAVDLVYIKKIDGVKQKLFNFHPKIVTPGEHEIIVRTVHSQWMPHQTVDTERFYRVRAQFEADRTYAWQADEKGRLVYLTVMPVGFVPPKSPKIAATREYLAILEDAKRQPAQVVEFLELEE